MQATLPPTAEIHIRRSTLKDWRLQTREGIYPLAGRDACGIVLGELIGFVAGACISPQVQIDFTCHLSRNHIQVKQERTQTWSVL